MPCGCKKNKPEETVPTPVTISLKEVETKQQPSANLTDKQQQQIDKIADKLNQLKSNS
jgi:hypothetical protein